MQDRQRQLLELLESHGARIQALLTRLTLREDVAEELMQDLFVNLSRSLAFAKAADPGGYACRAAINLGLTWRRTQRPWLPIESVDPPAPAGEDPLDGLIADEQVRQVLEALDQLPVLYRDAIVMRYIQQEPYEAMAACFGRTPQQLRSVCHKAIRSLRRLLGVPQPRAGEDSPCAR